MATLSFYISDLIADEEEFQVPSECGDWVFRKRHNYADTLAKLTEGMVGATFSATNWDVESGNVFEAIDELIDACLLLSFFTSKCVIPSRVRRRNVI